MTGRYAKRRLDNTRYSKKSNETRSYAKAMTRRYTMRKTSITRDETSEMIQKEICNTRGNEWDDTRQENNPLRDKLKKMGVRRE